MSSYPPPPPGHYPPPYDRAQRKAQQQMLKAQARAAQAQARAQRQQIRMQQRSLRRRSVLGPLILVGIGVAFLLTELGRISWGQSLEWYSRWWPAVLIAAGMVLLAEWAVDQRLPSAQGQVRSIGAGVVFLLVLLALTGLSAHGIEYGMAWHDNAFGDNYARLNHLFGDRHDAEDTLSSSIAPGATLVIHNPHGDVTLSGDSTDGEVHVSVHTESYAWKDADAADKARRLRPVFGNQGNDLTLDVANVEGGQADLTIELPRTSAVTIQANNGAVTINNLAAAVAVSADHGDLDISAITGPVNLHVHDDDANITLHSITGPVVIDGRGGDTEVSDVHGDLAMQGDFFGATHLQHVNGAVRFDSSRTRFSAARLDDEFSISHDSLDASQLVGPVVLKTADKNITLDRVAGSVDVTNRNGSVAVTHAPPSAAISIQNTHGSVDLGLPGSTGFTLSAQTRNGDMENDFGLETQGSESNRSLKGNVAGGGPPVDITTTDGDVTIRRSTIAPVPPVPPAPPITFNPPAPPKAPKAPKPPAPPVGKTF
jgi:DUF4097 and DUF4098 domain-containing protein YvlB